MPVCGFQARLFVYFSNEINIYVLQLVTLPYVDFTYRSKFTQFWLFAQTHFTRVRKLREISFLMEFQHTITCIG